MNLKREGDSATAVLNQKHAKVVNVKERHIEQLLEHEQRLKKELEEKKQTAAGYYNKLLAAHKEIKELHRRIAQMEAENRRKN
ncbi:MAG: hypothetical protein LBR86_05905 [Tannerella sp.]|nr:hypothetical protein [Tannerella sp.]